MAILLGFTAHQHSIGSMGPQKHTKGLALGYRNISGKYIFCNTIPRCFHHDWDEDRWCDKFYILSDAGIETDFNFHNLIWMHDNLQCRILVQEHLPCLAGSLTSLSNPYLCTPVNIHCRQLMFSNGKFKLFHSWLGVHISWNSCVKKIQHILDKSVEEYLAVNKKQNLIHFSSNKNTNHMTHINNSKI